MNLDRCLIVGRITLPIELREDDHGHEFTTLPIAVNRRKKNADGTHEDLVTFLEVVCFGKTARIASERLSVGSEVIVEGHHQNHNIVTPDGRQIMITRIAAHNIQWPKGARS